VSIGGFGVDTSLYAKHQSKKCWLWLTLHVRPWEMTW
jgi:hypothetical protein